MQPTVLIVGAGPVGLTLAAELARLGVPFRIVDKSPARTDKSKAIVIWSRTLELMDRLGCANALLDAGVLVKGANIVSGESNETLAHVRLDSLQTPHPYALMLPQSDTERLMEEHLSAHNVALERRVALVRFSRTDDHADAVLLHPDGREETLRVRWLIGCDGAHSTVRHGLGIDFEGETLPSEWILADLHLAGLGPRAHEINTFWHSAGVLATFPISPGEGRYRVIADIGDGRQQSPGQTGNILRTPPTLAQVQAILDQRGPRTPDGTGMLRASDSIWLAAFGINERKVTDYRHGNVFLAGDAAHIHSPAGGQGMNTGMQDAFNLAWKLALVHHGLAASEPLLNSYSIERSAVGRQVLADAGRLTAIAILRNRAAQVIRNHVAAFAFGLPGSPVPGIMANKLSELSIGYPESPLTLRPRIGHAPAGPMPGTRAPVSGPLASRIGAGAGADAARFVLCAAQHESAAAFVARHAGLVSPQIHAPYADTGLWLVRPDGYISVAARTGEWETLDAFLKHAAPTRSATA